MRPIPVRAPRALAVALAAAAAVGAAHASSHREAPFITTQPKVDATDFYMFTSYEPGRAGYVTLIANYLPLQDPYGGPNYFSLDPNALYEIHVDNDGDAREDLTFQFRFQQRPEGRDAADRRQAGADSADPGRRRVRPQRRRAERERELHDRRRARRPPRRPAHRRDARAAARASTSRSTTSAPRRSPTTPPMPPSTCTPCRFPAARCTGRVFVGQRKDPFAVNLGEVFDLVNAPVSVITDPALIGAAPNIIDDKNVTTLALEVHASCLVEGQRPGDRRLDHRQPAPGRAARPDARRRPPDRPRAAAAHGRRCRAWACRS